MKEFPLTQHLSVAAWYFGYDWLVVSWQSMFAPPPDVQVPSLAPVVLGKYHFQLRFPGFVLLPFQSYLWSRL